MKDVLKIRQLTKQYSELNQPILRKFRIVPEWEKDVNLQNAQPKAAVTESFIVKRK